MSKLSLKLQNIEEMNKKILTEGEGIFGGSKYPYEKYNNPIKIDPNGFGGGPTVSERQDLMIKLKDLIDRLINTGVDKQELLNKIEVFLNNRK